MRNEKGITLIALVITIIVLLILAGISLAMLTGDNGLLTRSQKSANDNAIGGAKDIVSMDIQDGNVEYLQKYYSTTSTSDRQESSLSLRAIIEGSTSPAVTGKIPAKANGCDVEVDSTKNEITISKDNRKCVGSVAYTAAVDSTSPATYVVTWGVMQDK